MINHSDLTNIELFQKLRRKEFLFAGNSRLKIFGLLTCNSFKRLKRKNRVFFTTKKDALSNGFRPCGKCLPKEYKKWKYATI
ncbi:Ada metal-binding domain-containing protein [Epilithonimonas hominis]|uniref:Ada metal-binding domain-containing protein n=1 Tax=Epilithonimonas hominis TaxID=420404 RepID=UPI00289B5316|nr:Ada metal-binding domain-containing protein [Epilithonimonas hominis]